MRIAEIYQSRQGEGFLSGTPSVFVRASGCNLRCEFCDTPYASWEPEGEDLSLDEILQQIQSFSASHVVLTGGEPMLFAEMVPLCHRLNRLGRHITIETAGTLYLPLHCDLMSISPKLSNSTPTSASERWRQRHERTRYAPEVIHNLISVYAYQIKFVVRERNDVEEVEAYLEKFPEMDRQRVMLMPEGTTTEVLQEIGQWLEPYCRNRKMHFCPRRQIEWFGKLRGT